MPIDVKVGDLVRYQGRPWQVKSYNSGVQTCLLMNMEAERVEVADDDPDLHLIGRPQADWPFLACPVRASGGPIVKVTRAGQELEPLVDWVASSWQRSGGSIFFNPALELRVGEVLVGHHQSRRLSRLNITKGFATVAKRKARAKKPEGPQSRADWINRGYTPLEDL